jgi:RNA polymerase sigma-70 factor (ECF subfamily)
MAASSQEIERVYRGRFANFVAAVTAIVRDPDDAAEVVQDGFARALARRRDFRSEGQLEAWIWTIVLRQAYDRLAATGPDGVPFDEVPEVGAPTPEGDPALAAALRSLSPRRRLVIYLYYLADLPYPEVARICGVSEGTVAATLAQARSTLATILADQRGELVANARRTQ